MSRDVIIGCLVLLAAVVLAFLCSRLRRRLKRRIYQVKSIGRLISDAAIQEIESTPKSVSGMTKIYLPKITRDFPDFDYGYYRQLTENTLADVLNAKSVADVSRLKHAADSLKEQVKHGIEGQKENSFDTVKIHKTEIMKYEKTGEAAVITFQSSVEQRGKNSTVQTKYNIELAYIQSDEKISQHTMQPLLGSICPNCAAPVKSTSGNCEYCGSLLTVINIRSWKYIRFSRVL